MKSTLDAALSYLKRGWSVIPVSPQSKKPLIQWEEFHKRRATATEVHKWWTKWPDASVGIVTGKVSNLVVVDADAKAQHLIDTLPETTLKSRTGSGWFHYYYAYPPNTDNVPNVVRKDGFDVRADGGYVVAPPSMHASGQRYRWLDKRREGIPIVPSLVFREPSSASGNGNGAHSPEDRNWLSRIIDGVGHGERNDAATRLAGYYFSKQMPFDVVLSNMELWNERNDPPLTERELVTTIRSVFGKENRRPPRPTQQERDPLEDPFALVSMSEYMTKFGGESASWLVDGWFPESTIGLMVAPPGSYKTWLELDLAVSVATGTPFLGQFKVNKTGPVIIVQQEDFHGQMAERLATIVHSRINLTDHASAADEFVCTLPPALPIHLHPDRRLRFNDAVVLEALETKIAQIRPRLVVIDPLYSTGDTDDYLAATVNQMFALKTMRDKYGCSFLLAHHTGKNKNEGTDREAAWGSQFVNAFLETGWQIRRKESKGQIIVRRHFKVSPDIEEITVTMDISTSPPYRYSAEIREVTEKDREQADRGNAIMEVFARGGAFSPQEVAMAIDSHRTTAHRRLEKLVIAEVLKRTLDGKYALIDDMTV